MRHLLEPATNARMHARLAQKFKDEQDYRVIHYLLGSPRVLEWAHTVGVARDDELAACVSPVPPATLRSIVADHHPEIFLFSGLNDLTQFIGYYRAHSQTARPAVLDFGCGCGRMTRFLDMMPDWQASGSEINPDHVAWCRENLKKVDTRQNSLLPPLPFDDASFDFVYSLSIFSHLPEPRALAWLADLKRVLKPNGILIVTTHGVHALDTILTSPDHLAMMIRSREEFAAIRADFENRPYVFQAYTPELAGRAKAGDEYGNVFVHPKRSAEWWRAGGFEALDHVVGGMQGWQDIHVLRSAP
jgi:SAM-dependent methyltransferase